MLAGATRKHHYIPVFYLKKWLARNNAKNNSLTITEFCKTPSGIKFKYKTPSQTGYKIDLYTRDDLPKTIQDMLEKKIMSKIDNDAYIVHKNLLENKVPTNIQERSIWVRFIMSIIHRNPERIKNLTYIFDKSMQFVSEDIKQNYEKYRKNSDPVSYQELEKQLNPFQNGYDFNLLFSDLMNDTGLGNILINMFWKVVETDKFPILTSDRPLVGSNGFLFRNNMIRPDGHFCMALSPEKLFLATNTKECMKEILKKSNRLFYTFNKRISECCKNSIYSNTADQYNFIQKHFGSKKPVNLGIPDDINDMITTENIHRCQEEYIKKYHIKGN